MKHSCSRLPSLPSPAQSCPVLLSPTLSLLPLAHLSLLLPHFALLSFFFLVPTSVFITLSNILSVIYLFIYLFLGQKQAAIQPFISDFCVAGGGDVGLVLLAYFKVVATAMLTALEAQLGFTPGFGDCYCIISQYMRYLFYFYQIPFQHLLRLNVYKTMRNCVSFQTSKYGTGAKWFERAE